MKIAVIITLLFILPVFGIKGERVIGDDATEGSRSVFFEGKEVSRNSAMELVDRALWEHGDLGVYGNLSGGLEEIIKEMFLRITDEGEYYSVSVWPKSGCGHDFGFTVSKTTGEISNVVVGEVLPEPGFE